MFFYNNNSNKDIIKLSTTSVNIKTEPLIINTTDIIAHYYLIEDFKLTIGNLPSDLNIKYIYKLNYGYFALLSNNNIYKIDIISNSWSIILYNINFLLCANETLFAIGETESNMTNNGNDWVSIQYNTNSNLGSLQTQSVDVCYNNNSYYLLINNLIYIKNNNNIYWTILYQSSISTYKHISVGNNILILSDNNKIYYGNIYANKFSINNSTYVNPINIKKFIFVNGLFIGINNNSTQSQLGGILYSTDGNNWTEVTNSSSILYNCITFNNDKLIAFGTDTDGNKLSIGIINNNTITCAHYNYNKNITDLVLK